MTAGLVYGARQLIDRQAEHPARSLFTTMRRLCSSPGSSILGVLCHVLMDLPTS